jgi:uncharacterized cupredoxin-like copper-binding protein
MTRRFASLVAVALIATFALAACGGGGGGAPAARTLSVDAAEFTFTPNSFTAKVGEALTFTINNKGTLEHNFVVFDPLGAEIARTTVAIGSSANVNVTVSSAGDYGIVCDVAGHKEAGMVATLTVSP